MDQGPGDASVMRLSLVYSILGLALLLAALIISDQMTTADKLCVAGSVLACWGFLLRVWSEDE